MATAHDSEQCEQSRETESHEPKTKIAASVGGNGAALRLCSCAAVVVSFARSSKPEARWFRLVPFGARPLPQLRALPGLPLATRTSASHKCVEAGRWSQGTWSLAHLGTHRACTGGARSRGAPDRLLIPECWPLRGWRHVGRLSEQHTAIAAPSPSWCRPHRSRAAWISQPYKLKGSLAAAGRDRRRTRPPQEVGACRIASQPSPHSPAGSGSLTPPRQLNNAASSSAAEASSAARSPTT